MAIITTPTYVCDLHGKDCKGGEVKTYRFVGQVTDVITKTEKVQTGTEKKIVNDEIVEIPTYEEKETTETVIRVGLLEKELCEKSRKAHEEATALLGDTDNREIRSLPSSSPTGQASTQETLPGTSAGSAPKLTPELQEEIRAWARGIEGLEVKDRGRLPNKAVTMFFKTHPDRKPAE